ncbi:MAG: YbaK/EbsC family protein [Limnohabitans sp.]|nr:YbaK/EbsC family protein [Limnohabitans sp.]
MSLESVRQYFIDRQINMPILETQESTATVALAAQAHGVELGRIAKTLAFRLAKGDVILLVASGVARIDHQKFKRVMGKGKMLSADDVEQLTGHPVGGVCPFGLAQELPIYLDQSLQAYDEVWPAAGSINSAIRISTQQLAQLTQGQWVDVCSVLTST